MRLPPRGRSFRHRLAFEEAPGPVWMDTGGGQSSLGELVTAAGETSSVSGKGFVRRRGGSLMDADRRESNLREVTPCQLRIASSSRRVHVVVDGCSKGCYLPGLEHRHEPTPTSSSWHRDLDAHRGVRRCRRRHRERRGVRRARPIHSRALPVVGTGDARPECEPHFQSWGGVHHSVSGQLQPAGGVRQRAGARLLDDLRSVHQAQGVSSPRWRTSRPLLVVRAPSRPTRRRLTRTRAQTSSTVGSALALFSRTRTCGRTRPKRSTSAGSQWRGRSSSCPATSAA